MNPLPIITAAALPPLAYTHTADHNPALTRPEYFRPIRSTGYVKPAPGTGLWTAPITEYENGLPCDTAWLKYCREELTDRNDTHLTEVFPNPDVRVLHIDTHPDLIAIVDAYPAEQPVRGTRLNYPDWEHLAADGWDAVYLTEAGQWATRLPRTGPDLYSWDLASVLWLRPTYTTGRTIAVAAAPLGRTP